MKRIGIFAAAALFVFLVSCSEQETEKSPFEEEYLIVRKEIVERFKNSNIVEKEIVKYHYDSETDFFWKKAVYKSDSGDVSKTVYREFQKEGRLPVKEYIVEFGTDTTESRALKYSMENFEPLERTTYSGKIEDGKKSKYEKWNYDDNGYLTSKEIVKYSTKPGFMNEDSTSVVLEYKLRTFPRAQDKPKGEYLPFYLIESLKKYATGGENKGKLIAEENTNFNEFGFPTHRTTTDPDCESGAKEEWFKAETDSDGRLESLTSYADKELTKFTEKNSQYLFEYDDNGWVSQIDEYKYDSEEEEFVLLHDLAAFKWIKPAVDGRHSFIDYELTNEHYCFHSHRHSMKIKKITKFDEVGEKVVEEHFGFYKGEYDSQEIELKLRKRTTYFYDKFEKKDGAGVLKKNKKIETR